MLQTLDAIFATDDLVRDAQPVVERDVVGLLGFGGELFDFLAQQFDLLARMLIADRRVLAGIGLNLRSLA